jgi:hypothetical protein
MAVPGCFPFAAYAAGGLADDAGGGQLPEQAERRLRRAGGAGEAG